MSDDQRLAPQEIRLYAALEDATAAVESERQRLAQQLDHSIIDSLNLLLSQASVYEQTLSANPPARMAVSVLASLARQLLQQARDLQASLHPTLLHTLGLEPALEAMAGEQMRNHGLQIHLHIERLQERLPPPVELALFRVAQEALHRAIHHAHASRANMQLRSGDEVVIFSFSDNGIKGGGHEIMGASIRRIEQLNGVTQFRTAPNGRFELTIRFHLERAISLTERELEVIQLVAEGLSNKEIASALQISARTINFHLDNIYSKLGVNSRTGAAVYALRQGWLRDPGQNDR